MLGQKTYLMHRSHSIACRYMRTNPLLMMSFGVWFQPLALEDWSASVASLLPEIDRGKGSRREDSFGRGLSVRPSACSAFTVFMRQLPSKIAPCSIIKTGV